jgi:beta-phosphoglucomutase
MRAAAPFQACIFDMDGVLADSMRQHHRAYVQVLEPLGVSVPRRDVFLREGMNSPSVIREILAQHRIPVSEDEARRLGERKQAAFRAMGRPPLHRGAERALQALRGAGLKLGVVTGSSRENAAFVLRGIVGRFGVVLAEGDYARSKPDPDPYLTAAARLGAEPTRCAVVENAPLGVRAAVAAGMACVALPTTVDVEELRAAGAHAIAVSLEEAAALVLRGQGFKRV